MHDDEYIHETTRLDDKLLLDVDGMNILDESSHRIGPIQNFHISSINENSRQLVHRHATHWPFERILQQRHTLYAIPIYECNYTIEGGATGDFWVYGEEQLVEAPDYPAKFCCCLANCSIM